MIVELLPDRNHPAVIPIQPWAKKRPRISQAVAGKKRRTHQPPDDKEAEDRTRDWLEGIWKFGPETGNIRLGLRFYRRNRQVVDLDNLIKHFKDAATGILWVDDCQVTAYDGPELFVDAESPRTEFWLEPHDTSMVRAYKSPQ